MFNTRIKILLVTCLIFSLLFLPLVLSGCKKSETNTSIATIADSSLGTNDNMPFTFAVSGDSRPLNDSLPQPQNFIDILNSMKTFNPAFYISTGDIIYGGSSDTAITKREFSDYLKAVSVLNIPVYVAAGNHETQSGRDRNTFDKLFRNEGKTYYYFNYNNVYFIILDAYQGKYMGQIRGNEIEWLNELLPTLKTEKVFVFIHPPVYSYLNPDCITDGSKKIGFIDKENQDYIKKLFKDNNVDGVFSGHEHMFHKQKEGNTEYIITGLSGAEPNVSKEEGGFYHFLIIDVKEKSWVFKVMDVNGKLIEENEINFN